MKSNLDVKCTCYVDFPFESKEIMNASCHWITKYVILESVLYMVDSRFSFAKEFFYKDNTLNEFYNTLRDRYAECRLNHKNLTLEVYVALFSDHVCDCVSSLFKYGFDTVVEIIDTAITAAVKGDKYYER